jgi:pimeloyl-ACP methyl ester carboxylesterase
MKLCLATVLASILFIPVFLVSAQTPCGSVIIIPADFNYAGSQESSNPVQDCSNPFARTEDLDGFLLKNQIVVNNSIYNIEEAGTADYGFADETYGNTSEAVYYLHSGQDYVKVKTNFFEPTQAAYDTGISDFFGGNQIQIDLYKQIPRSYPSGSYFFVSTRPTVYKYDPVNGEKVMDVYNELQEYLRLNVLSPRRVLLPGTYTVVLEHVEIAYPTYEKSLLKKFFSFIIPTVYANHYVKTVTFTLAGPTPEPVGASSVLFLPGIQASRLYKIGLLGTEDEVWVPDGNQDVRQLSMTTSGISENEIYAQGIIPTLPIGGTVYDSFARSMVNLVQDEVIKAWTPFAYDWRYGVDDIAQNGTQYENEVRDIVAEIEYLAENSFSNKVTIIGHSNGGLLAKAVMKRLEQEGRSNLVDKIIFLASPQLGTPKSIGTILHGYDQEKLGGWVIDDVVARDVIQNMPGAYGLVTSQQYFNSVPDKVITFENSTATQLFRNAYGESIDSAEELKRFMVGSSDNRPQAQNTDEILRANASLLGSALTLHDTALDIWTAPQGVEVIEVIGTGLDTVSGFEYRTFTERVCSVLGTFSCVTKDLYKPVPIISQKGDKTVMALSAEGYGGTKNKYYIDLKRVADIKIDESVEHYNISENPSIQKLITNILIATSSDIEFISSVPTEINAERLLLGVHSPVTLEVVDEEGRKAGRKTVNGMPTKEETIPGSTYLEIGGSKYVIVPADGTYDIKLKGTAEGGATFSLDRLGSSVQVPEISVRIATVTASTTIGIKYADAELSNLQIDSNGDSMVDTVLTPLGVDVTPKITYKTLKDKIKALPLSSLRKLPLLALVDTAELLDKKSVINPKLTVAEVYTLNQLEALLAIYQQKGWITQANMNELKIIIGKLK